MRLVSSKTLLTLATALVAVPGAAMAAAEPGEPLFQIASSDTDEIDCEALLEEELPEECEDDDADADADGDGDGTEGITEDDEEPTGDDGTDDEADDGDVGSQDAGEGDDTEDTDDDARGEIVSAVAACAPRGQERVHGFDLPNHGAYVSVAAKGETLVVGDVEYDLGALDGATRLCKDLAAARANAEAPEDAGDSEGDGTEETDELGTSGDGESAAERDGPAGPAKDQQRGGESGPPEQAGNGGGKGKGKGKGPQDAPGRNR